MNVGDCFVNKSAPNTPSHLWIVLSDPNQDAENILLVNLTDADNHHDDSCILQLGDHDWITKASAVAYQWAKLTSAEILDTASNNNLLFDKAALDDDVLQKVLEGAYTSDELSGKHRELLRNQGLID